jgi:hypothetical protein
MRSRRDQIFFIFSMNEIAILSFFSGMRSPIFYERGRALRFMQFLVEKSHESQETNLFTFINIRFNLKTQLIKLGVCIKLIPGEFLYEKAHKYQHYSPTS